MGDYFLNLGPVIYIILSFSEIIFLHPTCYVYFPYAPYTHRSLTISVFCNRPGLISYFVTWLSMGYTVCFQWIAWCSAPKTVLSARVNLETKGGLLGDRGAIIALEGNLLL